MITQVFINSRYTDKRLLEDEILQSWKIDIVAVDAIEKKLLICEVTLNKKRLNYNELVLKSQKLIQGYKDYTIEYKLLSLEDIAAFL